MTKEKLVEEAVVSETPSQVEKELTFVFKVSQANTILAALDEIPHKLSRNIIDSMQQQAVPQLQEQAA
ncbi:hypothetical protein UFOVP1655_194 [uncultured Caudovirales phage]|uniref:Uncharacterized protein n=1 Tax=uncultured Caudovirales phage TaxID=2100421 RepID=A0A6J5T6Q3_9CAUD|nr:hypothetical protein UFOVP1655_194 [uncultured Caudovirales phage]